jgi:hypothetical protein
MMLAEQIDEQAFGDLHSGTASGDGVNLKRHDFGDGNVPHAFPLAFLLHLAKRVLLRRGQAVQRHVVARRPQQHPA